MYLVTTFLLVTVALWYGKIEQQQSYHNFADDRVIVGVTNAVDVLSNLAILVPGLLGIALMYKRQSTDYTYYQQFEPIILLTLFGGMVVTAIGSMWYHLDPNDSTLVWDRMAMTVVMTALCSLVISDRFSGLFAAKIHIPLLFFGLFTVLYWHFVGDLRPYYIFKLQAPIILVALLIFGQESYDRVSDYVVTMMLFLLASILEYEDYMVFDATSIISGHSLKHLVAGIGFFWLLRMVEKRTLQAR